MSCAVPIIHHHFQTTLRIVLEEGPTSVVADEHLGRSGYSEAIEHTVIYYRVCSVQEIADLVSLWDSDINYKARIC